MGSPQPAAALPALAALNQAVFSGARLNRPLRAIKNSLLSPVPSSRLAPSRAGTRIG